MAAIDAPPIPPGTIRVTVVLPGSTDATVTADIPTGAIVQTLRALEDDIGSAMTIPRAKKAAYAVMAAAGRAVNSGDDRTVTAAGLWLFLHHPGDEHAMNGQRLSDTLADDGAALIIAIVGRTGGGWRFRFHPMPRWPVAVKDTATPNEQAP
jgi:hypothetical protein